MRLQVNMNTEMVRGMKISKPLSVANYYVAIAFNIILLYVLNNLQYFGLAFLTSDYISCLWAINLSLSFGIIGNFILLVYRPLWFHHMVQAILCALAILAVYIVYSIFPFSFDAGVFQNAVRIILILIMAGTGIGFIAEVIQLGKALIKR